MEKNEDTFDFDLELSALETDKITERAFEDGKDTIRAKKIILEDDFGNPRMMMGFFQNSTLMYFLDSEGNSRISFGLLKDSPFLYFLEPDGTIALGLGNKQGARLFCIGCPEEDNITLSASKYGPSICLCDQKSCKSISPDSTFVGSKDDFRLEEVNFDQES